MSGDHNQHQKDKSYLDGMDRYKQVRELVKDPSLKIKDIVELTGYDKGHVSRLRKASQQFECPRCGHCCQALVDADDTSQERVDEKAKREQEPVAWISEGGDVSRSKRYMDDMGFKCNPLYTAPPKREWVGLTADEIWKCNKAKSGSAVEFHICYAHQNVEDFAEAIEAKLKEKNA